MSSYFDRMAAEAELCLAYIDLMTPDFDEVWDEQEGEE